MGTELLPQLHTYALSTVFVISWPFQYPSLEAEMRQGSIVRNTKGIFSIKPTGSREQAAVFPGSSVPGLYSTE